MAPEKTEPKPVLKLAYQSVVHPPKNPLQEAPVV